ncbi:hypothetical protein N7478_001736 [Penicillium angulare]|uniref:uncharacterized protein n=1 Tax=Penicillium angulare TaxID=116970 RepID=UPI0025405BFC|nr:uncharacterized protein N7478_001736 [Penicillium angulare]KAJ5288706.1 hypothetical protein N7478_001736 [Penicillium angulare]
MQSESSRTAGQSATRFGRKYGPKFNAFDKKSNISMCSQELGPVHIDCRFRHSKTQLGVLHSPDNRAGILYIDIAFSQPNDCCLRSAVVWITLEQYKSGSQSTLRATGRAPLSRSHKAGSKKPYPAIDIEPAVEIDSDVPKNLQFTHYFGPKQLEGKPTQMLTKHTMHLTPEFNVLGNGGGGLGYERERSVMSSSRWIFTGHILPGSRSAEDRRHENNFHSMTYRTLKWELSEDELQPQPTHSSVIQTACALEHDDRPFFIRVEIEGKLRKRSAQLKSNVKQLFKFPSEVSRDDSRSSILVLPDKNERPTKRLDNIAEGLHLDMERLNMEGLGVQMPGSLPVSFQSSSEVPPKCDFTPTNKGQEKLETSTTQEKQPEHLLGFEALKTISSQINPEPFPSIRESEVKIPATPGDHIYDLVSAQRLHSDIQSHLARNRQQRCKGSLDNPLSTREETSKSADIQLQSLKSAESEELAAALADMPMILTLCQWMIYINQLMTLLFLASPARILGKKPKSK